jgi:hypothetical protein
MWLLKTSLDVHVSTFSQCWQVLWVTMGCMCNVNMCITFYRWLCFVGSRKSSFITTHGVEMKFKVCWSTLKPLNYCDSTSQLYLHQINCDFVIHKACLPELCKKFGFQFPWYVYWFYFGEYTLMVFINLFPFRPIITIKLLTIIRCFHVYHLM